MSSEITTAFVKQFSSNLTMLAQQKGSKLRNAVRIETLTGEEGFFEQIGAVEAQDVTDRHGDSPQMDVPHSRRRVAGVASDVGDYIDTFDKVQMLIDPSSQYVQSFIYALGRKMDDRIIAAATGTAYTGKTGTTSVALPSRQKVAVTVGAAAGYTNAGLTIEKLIAAKSLFGKNDVDIEDPMNKLTFVVSQQQLDDLLNEVEVKSSDYNTVKALVKGEVDSFMGFDFIRTQRLALNATTDIRTCFAFARSGLLLAVNKDITTRVTERADKRFSWYAYASMMCGATRMEEEKVVEVPCDESPAAS
jgi:hypothetical protein